MTSRIFGYVKAAKGLFVAGCILLGGPAMAQMNAMTGTYYVIPGNHPDFNRGTQDTANVTGLVENFLGPDGLPVRSAKGATYPGPTPPLGTSGPITDVNAQNEILWWSSSSTITNHAKYEKTQIDTLPFAFNNLVPDGQTTDSPSLLAIHYQATFTSLSAQTISFTYNVDDDLYGYVDGSLIIDAGGVVHRPTTTVNITSLAPGQHTLDLFYVDREKGGAFLNFSSNVTLVPSGSAPEPSTVMLLVAGGAFAGCLGRRRFQPGAAE